MSSYAHHHTLTVHISHNNHTHTHTHTHHHTHALLMFITNTTTTTHSHVPLPQSLATPSPLSPPSPGSWSRKSQRLATMMAPSKLADRLTWTSAKRGFCFLSRRMSEHSTTESCVPCRASNKPSGRLYVCHSCGYRGHRDIGAAKNIAILTVTKHRLWRHVPLDALLCEQAGVDAGASNAMAWLAPAVAEGERLEGNVSASIDPDAAAAAVDAPQRVSSRPVGGTGDGPLRADRALSRMVPDAASSSGSSGQPTDVSRSRRS